MKTSYLLAILAIHLFCSTVQAQVTGRKYDLRAGIALYTKVPHARLSPEEVAIKRCVSFVMWDFAFYAQCFSEPYASKWRNKKPNTLKEHQAKQLNYNYNLYSYWVHSSKIEGNSAKVIFAEKIGSGPVRYSKIDLKKTAAGWIIEHEYEQEGNTWKELPL